MSFNGSIKIDPVRLKQSICNATLPGFSGNSKGDSACVFLLVFGKENDRYLLAIQKSDTPGYPWRNQVAFPGGHMEPKDKGPEETAFRELEEELHIHRSQVELVGSLGHFQTINQKDIQVFVGLWDGRGPVHYDTAEIARVLKIPLSELVRTHYIRRFHGRVPDIQELRYPLENAEIWGATARIVHFFLELVCPIIKESRVDPVGSVV